MPRNKASTVHTKRFVLNVDYVNHPRSIEHKVKGVRTKIGIMTYMALMFEHNENSPRHLRLCDEAIRQHLIAEFPHSKSVKRIATGQRKIGYYRSLYNMGKMTGDEIPKKLSKRYNEVGDPIDRWERPLQPDTAAITRVPRHILADIRKSAELPATGDFSRKK